MSDSTTFFEFVGRDTVFRILLGFLFAGIFILILAGWAGLQRVTRVVIQSNPKMVATGFLSSTVCLFCWAKAWHVVLRGANVDIRYRNIVITYLAATFANYITPLGQAGGEPFIAYVLSRDTESSYEDSLASVVTADLLNLIPFFFFLFGAGSVLLIQATLPDPLVSVVRYILVYTLLSPIFFAALWRYRSKVGKIVLQAITPLARRTRFITIDGVKRRMQDLNEAAKRVTSDPRILVHAGAFSIIGWVFFALPLYFAGLAVDLPLSLIVVFFVVPLSTLAGLTPSPGGLGGVEAAVAGLLAVLLSLSAADAVGVALLYRLLSYWFPLFLGGIAAILVVTRN